MSPAGQLLFFDLDDTLVDHRSAQLAAQRDIFEAHTGIFGGIPFADWLPRYMRSNAALWAAFGRQELDGAELRRRRFHEPLEELGLDPTGADGLSEEYMAAYERHWTLVDGALEILEHAAEHGTVGIVTNGFTETQRAKVERFRLRRWVAHVVMSEEVGAWKPAREIFDAAVRSAGAGGGRKVFVGDSFEHDVMGAKAAGWLPVLYSPKGTQPPAPCLYVTSLLDLKPVFE